MCINVSVFLDRRRRILKDRTEENRGKKEGTRKENARLAEAYNCS
jgi:hypothetical protein